MSWRPRPGEPPFDPREHWRAARDLRVAHLPYLLRRRMRRFVFRRFSAIAAFSNAVRASRIELPDPASPRLRAAVQPIRALREAEFAGRADGVREGAMPVLDQTLDFGDVRAIPWRAAIDQAGPAGRRGAPIRRNLLAEMGYVVGLLASGAPGDFETVHALVRALEVQNHWARPGALDDVWAPLTASWRAINLLAGVVAYREAAGEPHGLEPEVLAHIRFCVALVRGFPARDRPDALFANYLAMALYAASLEQPPERLSPIGDGVPRLLATLVLPDGGHRSRTPLDQMRLLAALDALIATGLHTDAWSQPLADFRARTAAALGVMCHPDGDIALFDDSWFGAAPKAAALIGPHQPPAERAVLADTGLIRLGGAGADVVILRAGAIHRHGDFLSLEASVGGARLIVDPAVATIEPGPLRTLVRSAASHNGPHVAGVEPFTFWDAAAVGSAGRARMLEGAALDGLAPLWCAGWHDGYRAAGIEVARYVGLWPGAGLLIADLWLGRTTQAQRSTFLIAGDWTVAEGRRGFRRAGDAVDLDALAGVLEEAEPARHWMAYGQERDATMVTVEAAAGAGGSRAALWWGWGADAAPPEAAALDLLFDRLAAAVEQDRRR